MGGELSAGPEDKFWSYHLDGIYKLTGNFLMFDKVFLIKQFSYDPPDLTCKEKLRARHIWKRNGLWSRADLNQSISVTAFLLVRLWASSLPL